MKEEEKGSVEKTGPEKGKDSEEAKTKVDSRRVALLSLKVELSLVSTCCWLLVVVSDLILLSALSWRQKHITK